MLPMTTTFDRPVTDGVIARWLVVGEGFSLREAIEKMSDHASANGAVDVIGVRIAFTKGNEMGSSFSAYVAYGTAVRGS